MANIAKIELGETTYDIKDESARSDIEAITDHDTNNNIYVKTPQLEVEGTSVLNGAVTTNSTFNSGSTITSGVGANEGKAFKVKSVNIDRDTSSVSSTIWGPRIEYVDKDNDTIGFVQSFQKNDGNIGMRMLAWSEKTDGTEIWNGLTLQVSRDGVASYSVSNPTAFRTAINAQEAGNYVTFPEGGNSLIGTPSGETQAWSIYSTVLNASNNDLKNHRVGLFVYNDHIRAYDGTNSTWLWSAYTTKNKPTPAAIGAQPEGNYATYADGTNVNLSAMTGTSQLGAWYWTVANTNNETYKTKRVATIFRNDTVSMYNSTGSETIWTAYTTKNKPTYSDVGAAAESHKHSAADITSGTLAITRGGTGVITNPSMLVNLASTTADTVFEETPRPGITGTLPVSHGGTGATTVTAARNALNVVMCSNQEDMQSNIGSLTAAGQHWALKATTTNSEDRYAGSVNGILVSDTNLKIYHWKDSSKTTDTSGTFSAMLGGKILYTSSAGSTGTITTTATIAPEPFTHMWIIYKGNDGFQHSSLVKLTVSGSGRTGTSSGTAALSVIENTSSVTTHNTNIKWRTVTISEQPRTSSDTKDPANRVYQISTSNYGEWDNGVAGTNNHIYILQVIGLYLN